MYSVAKKEIKETAPLKENLVLVFYTESVFIAKSGGNFLLQLSTGVIFAIFAYCHICFYAAKHSSCVCTLKTPPWKKEERPYWCIENEKFAAACLVLKRHLGPLPAEIF